MGILSAITGEAKRNFIARPEQARSDIIYKYPEKNIRLMTQLTCQPDELAIFVKEGKVQGKLGPGNTFTLDGRSIPFVSALLEKVTGGDFLVAEVYFVSMHEVPAIRFGGTLGTVTDSVTQMMCEAMVYGDFSVKVLDPEKLIFGLVGSGRALQTNNAFLEWFKGILLKFLSDAVGELGEKGWSLNKMLSPANKLELQEAVLGQIRGETDKYGLQVVQFGNFVLSIDDQAKAELNKRNMAIADDQRRMQLAQNPAYTTVAQTEMMRNAGAGMAKGGEGAGSAMTGLGLGMGMQMAQAMGSMAKPAAAAPAGTVSCPSCGASSAAGAFCSSCGKPLSATCSCGANLASGAKFCSSCGKPTGPRTCACGAQLAPGAKFCSGCGKPA